MQAAILIEKLKIFDDEIAARNTVAERYARGLGDIVTVPRVAAGCTSVWAQYTIRLPEGRRPRRLCRRAEGAGHSDRDLLSEVDASADRLPGFPGRRRRPAGLRTAVRTTSSACRCIPISTSRPRTRIIEAVRGALQRLSLPEYRAAPNRPSLIRCRLISPF